MTTIRLFAENVEEMQADAAKSGIPWQISLRLLVDEALKARKARKVIV